MLKKDTPLLDATAGVFTAVCLLLDVWYLTLPEFELHVVPQFNFSNAEGASKWEIYSSGLALPFVSELWEAASNLFPALTHEQNTKRIMSRIE